ncbi:hypothetical protein CEXT_685961 [Caerostris extrusa]|uniref:Uncharacterized protein n=1 Tax=Caerostris extrusa TaxID=172846 RepID=A0AAV4RYJ8_CAEEX|nr:hypothetical protein CEXT_685961 [Caerostris extrusa]
MLLEANTDEKVTGSHHRRKDSLCFVQFLSVSEDTKLGRKLKGVARYNAVVISREASLDETESCRKSAQTKKRERKTKRRRRKRNGKLPEASPDENRKGRHKEAVINETGSCTKPAKTKKRKKDEKKPSLAKWEVAGKSA